MPDQIKERSIGFSSSINGAFKELLTGKSFGAKTEGPTKPQPKPELTPEEKTKQEAVMQKFYPNYMIDQSTRPGSYPMYLTIDKDHPSLLHTVQYGQYWMYSIGDSALVHCFTQDGNYYQVKLGLDKSKNEVHGFYAEPATFIAIETTGNNGVGFSQINTDIPVGSDGAILIPRKDKLLQLFPDQRDVIERFSVDE
ncbi:MAG: Sir2 silent information regulator family NAD-dependent deacetylase [Lactobacillus sp.]|nr:Sir2 silent information regulator family NAD-dependent deacetylase [Lactobacillus sp.]